MPVLKIWSLALLYQNIIYGCFLGPFAIIGLPFEVIGSIPGLILCYILLKATPLLYPYYWISLLYVFLIVVATGAFTSLLTIRVMDLDSNDIHAGLHPVAVTAISAFFSAFTLIKSINKTILSYDYQTTS